MPRTWFLTGCSTGIGRQLAEFALARGENVVATARRPETLESLAGADSACLRLALDVTDAAQIEAARAAALERFGRVDVLVNNAGYGYFSTQEEANLTDVRAMYETNVFGLIAMTQAFLPHFREQKNGVIVHLSSMAGHMGTPRGGFYQSTKWAVEALGESLSLEVAPFGVRVVLIEPGRYETKFSTSAQVGPREADPDSPYAELRAEWTEHGGALFPESQDPAEVIEATWNAVESSEPLLRVPVGRDATMVVEERERQGGRAFAEWMRERLSPLSR